MANSPVQIVLNTNDFIEALEHNGGGSPKDFFDGNDADFLDHRDNLQKQLGEIRSMQLVSSYTKMSYAKVTLKQAALAKSHRPTSQIFKRDIAPIVGAGDLGELFVELTPESIDVINGKFNRVETKVEYKEKDGKSEPKPTRLRSEIGAIENIIAYTASDKRRFSAKEAIEWLSNPQTGGSYMVELFEAPPARKDWDLLSAYKFDLFESFIDGLENVGNGLFASRVITGTGTAVIFGVKLEKSSSPPVIQSFPVSSSLVKSKSGEKHIIDLDIKKHNKLLEFLDKHPLVKKISLPPIIMKSNAATSIKRGKTFAIPSIEDGVSYPKICVVDGGVSDIYGDWIEDRWGLISPSDKDENHGSFIAGLAIAGQTLNGNAICREIDGCKIIELDILPLEHKYDTYFPKPFQFFSELESAVQELKARTGVRVFNFSMNIEEHASTPAIVFLPNCWTRLLRKMMWFLSFLLAIPVLLI